MNNSEERSLQRTRLGAGCLAIVMLAVGSVAIANGDANHTCENCHSEDQDLCSTRECSSDEVCSGKEGKTVTGAPWVEATCVNRDELP